MLSRTTLTERLVVVFSVLLTWATVQRVGGDDYEWLGWTVGLWGGALIGVWIVWLRRDQARNRAAAKVRAQLRDQGLS